MALIGQASESHAEAAQPIAERPLKVFVTGGNGFIGSVVVRRLKQAGHQIRCLVRPTANTQRIDGVAVERIVGDVLDANLLRQAIAGQSVVLHLAGLSSWDVIDSPEMQTVVEGGLTNVLEAARQAGDVRVVFVSSVLAVGSTPDARPVDETMPYELLSDRQLAYSHHKYRGEQLCLKAVEQGQDVVIVNPTEVYGPDDIGLVTAGNLIDFGTSNPVLVCNGGTSLTHVDDIARGIIAAMERGRAGQRYILGGDNVTHRQLAGLFLELAGQRKRIVTVPNSVLRTITRAARALHLPLPYNYRVVPYATRYWFVDNGKARRELGLTFRGARETLAPTVAWIKAAGYVK